MSAVTGEVDRPATPLTVLEPRFDEPAQGLEKSNYCKQRSERSAGGNGIWPDLTHMLRKADDDEAVMIVVLWFLRLAHTATVAYTCIDSYHVFPISWTYKLKLKAFIMWYRSMVENPNAEEPAHIRFLLSELEITGNFQFVYRFVLPTMFGERDSKMLHCVEFYIFRWVLRAATHADHDPTGKIRQILGRTFNLDALNDLPIFIPGRRAYRIRQLVPNIGDLAKWNVNEIEPYLESKQHANDPYTGPVDPCDDIDTQSLNAPIRTIQWFCTVSGGVKVEDIMYPDTPTDTNAGRLILEPPKRRIISSEKLKRIKPYWASEDWWVARLADDPLDKELFGPYADDSEEKFRQELDDGFST
ncbi:hypothetical protein P280DRAFT_525296 [Massarina eburnea CBS 473.64]|uniref:Uncharacterized protein n=1 Tax=Massarina eburnea CBS 473.64 TaxID=1395130 RepID=A0A6A6SJV9_9PLEO|nr:hypothetical protein P280DRAFT_525296 [Massarina eburnea CBS 473.64]